MNRKQLLLDAILAFVAQRPGLEFANYGDVSAYRSEMRQITKDRHHAETLIRNVEWRSSITADDIIEASQSAFSGRLKITPIYMQNYAYYGSSEEDSLVRYEIDYCTGQYFPTEYRRAVCAVLAEVIWKHYRTECLPKGELCHTGDYLRRTMRREFGRSIASRWFS